jgi:hypothetical protein
LRSALGLHSRSRFLCFDIASFDFHTGDELPEDDGDEKKEAPLVEMKGPTCGLHDLACSIVAKRTVEVQMLLEFVEDVATSKGLTYTLACESLDYVYGRTKAAPMHGAIALSSASSDHWLPALKDSHYRLIHVSGDNSIAHLVFADDELAGRVIIHRLSDSYKFKTTKRAYPGSTKNMSAEVESEKKAFSAIVKLCNDCADHCRSPLLVVFQKRGYLLNAASRQCLSSKNATPEGITCVFVSVC